MLGHRIRHGRCSRSQSDYSGSEEKKRRNSGNNKDQFCIRHDDKVSSSHEDTETPRKRKACSTRSSDKLSILGDDDYKNRKIIPEQRGSCLPEDIVVEIIGRLPAKSISRLRCVCKHWNSFISSKRFVKVHLEISTRNPKFSHHNLISINVWKEWWRRPGDATSKQLSLQSLLYDQNTYAADIYFPTVDPSKKEYFRLIGSCNGLCCMIADRVDNFVLLNPYTTQYKTILTYAYCIPENFSFKPDSYGFGMSDDGDNYKLVCVGYLHSISREQESARAWVIYTLKTNSWRMVRNRKYFRSQTSGHGLFMNGKIHWLVHDGRSIVSFDLETETEGWVYPPDNVCCETSSLGELGGSLCLIVHSEISKDVWVLKEYGINNSWVKVLDFPNAGYPWDRSIRIRPLCISVEGEFLFVYGSKFIIYNPKIQSFRSAQLTNYPIENEICDDDHQVTVYVESLVSPFADAELDEFQVSTVEHELVPGLSTSMVWTLESSFREPQAGS